jgi:peptide methionine sulfoxide reductase MsrB
MKKLEDISVTFIWGGKQITAYADVNYKTHRVDLGPEGHRENVFCDVPYDMSLSRVCIYDADKQIEDAEEDLAEFAEQLLMEEADEILCEKA